MSQCPSVSGTAPTVIQSLPSSPLLEATPYYSQGPMSPSASGVDGSQLSRLSQLSPEGLKRRLYLDSPEPLRGVPEGSQISSDNRPLSRRRLHETTGEPSGLTGLSSFVLSTAGTEREGSVASAAVPEEGEEDLGDAPQDGSRFRRTHKCIFLTYSKYVLAEDTPHTSRYEVIKELIDHLYTLKDRKGSSLLQYAVGVTESHVLEEDQLLPNWHCHVLVWAQDLITSEAKDLWTFKGCRPREKYKSLKGDKAGFPPLVAYRYMKKEADAWEAHYGNLTEEFLEGQSPLIFKPSKNNLIVQELEEVATSSEDLLQRIRRVMPWDLAKSFGNARTYAQWAMQAPGALPEGVFPPTVLKEPTINLPPGVMPWVQENILNRDSESDRGRILILYGPSRTGKSVLARSWGNHCRFRNSLNSDHMSNDKLVQYAVLDDMDWTKVPLKIWVQEDFNFRTAYRPKRFFKWGRSTVFCANAKPLVFADCSYNTPDGKDWIDANCTYIYIPDKLY